MITLMVHVGTGTPQAIHRTFLSSDGKKLGRKMLGPAKGAAVKFAAAGETLVVSEGIETGLAAMAAGIGPTWAMGSAGAIGALAVIPQVTTLKILAESDGASWNAITCCASRWSDASKHMFVVALAYSKDFADVWAYARERWREYAVTIGVPS